MVRNLGRLVPAISHDVSDWLVPTRVRTSQLLSVLLLHSEDHSTQHLQPLLATLYRACGDTEKDVVSNVSPRELSHHIGRIRICCFSIGYDIKATHLSSGSAGLCDIICFAASVSIFQRLALGGGTRQGSRTWDAPVYIGGFCKIFDVPHIQNRRLPVVLTLCVSSYLPLAHTKCLAAAKLLGTFVSPGVFLKLLLEHVTAPSSPSHPWTPLMVLAAVLGGCPRPLLTPHLQQVADTLVQPDVCQEYQQVSRATLVYLAFQPSHTQHNHILPLLCSVRFTEERGGFCCSN